MNLNDSPSANRVHIGFFGETNVGKSSLVNVITRQPMSIVSEQKGTTTDPVRKSMELLPLGPVVIIDTPGLNDDTFLGQARKEQAEALLHTIDIGVLVVDASRMENEVFALKETEQYIINELEKEQIPFLIVLHKIDLCSNIVSLKNSPQYKQYKDSIVLVSSVSKSGTKELLDRFATLIPEESKKERHFITDCLKPGARAILVIPIDSGAPKGRIILPQQQVLRELLESGVITTVVKETELEEAIKLTKPDVVITDSQAFHLVSPIVPSSIYLTSFSILMARYKGTLAQSIAGAEIIDQLPEHSNILISEGCTHHRQCDDIGSVKLPKWIHERTKKEFSITFTSGRDFKKDLTPYDLVIHCGGCMLSEKEIAYRYQLAKEQNTPITNYGIFIAHLRGILKRSIAIFENKEIE